MRHKIGTEIPIKMKRVEAVDNAEQPVSGVERHSSPVAPMRYGNWMPIAMPRYTTKAYLLFDFGSFRNGRTRTHDTDVLRAPYQTGLIQCNTILLY